MRDYLLTRDGSSLNDPNYSPRVTPDRGLIPAEVEQWGAKSQYRWFARFYGDLKPQPHKVWDHYFCDSTAHKGLCCTSCVEDKNEGYGDDINGCCCRGLLAEVEQ